MSYRYSALDINNIQWFLNDNGCASLKCIALIEGHLRGINKLRLNFSHPISAIAGENGSGKSTILAMAACAYHNRKTGFKPLGRKTTYYTFSDFFVQSKDEIPPQGVHIQYQFQHNNWTRSAPGLGWQSRKKREGGKWNDYAKRVNRNVIYFGIQRVVPHFERSTHKSYRGYFRPGRLDETVRRRITEVAGRIVGRNYTDFDLHEHFKYSLPITTYNGVRYSGFNMGAGESAIFDILTALFAAGRGALIVIDEIELGLHEKAQSRLIQELKQICNDLHCQVICSTHSHVILRELPPEGRFYIDNNANEMAITPGISPDLACGKLRGKNTGELSVFVEDGAAQSILQTSLPYAIRSRINIHPIGSSEAVLRQLTSRYIEDKNNCLAILDGDKFNSHVSNLNKIANYAEASTAQEKENARQWGISRITYLPGNQWPELWLVEQARTLPDKSYLVQQWGVENDGQVSYALSQAVLAGKHNEFFVLGDVVSQDIEQVRADLIRFVNSCQPAHMKVIIKKIIGMLD